MPLLNSPAPWAAAFAVATVLALILVVPAPPPGVSGVWQTLTPLPAPRRVMCAVSHDRYIHVIGGVDDNGRYARQTLSSQLDRQGRPGPWRPGPALLTPRIYHACVYHDGWIYVVGGGGGPLGDDNRPLASVERAPVLADGQLGPFQSVNTMVLARRGVAVIQRGQWLYAVGGYDGRFLKSSERARLTADGTLGPWQLEAQESVIDRYIHAATASADRLILLGGHMRSPDSPSYGDVETTSIDKQGHLNPWRVSPSHLLEPRFMAAAVTLGEHVYLLGGHNGSARLASTETSRLNLFGETELWHPGPALPQALSGHVALGHRDYIYVLGGVGQNGVSAQVYMARQGDNGELLPP